MVDVNRLLSDVDPGVIDLLTRVNAGTSSPTRTNVPIVQQQTRLTKSQAAELVESYRQGVAVRDICAEWAINKNTVFEHLRRAGIKPDRGGSKLGDAEIERATELYSSGLSLKVVGEHLGVDASTVRNTLAKAGVKIRARNGWPSRGEVLSMG